MQADTISAMHCCKMGEMFWTRMVKIDCYMCQVINTIVWILAFIAIIVLISDWRGPL